MGQQPGQVRIVRDLSPGARGDDAHPRTAGMQVPQHRLHTRERRHQIHHFLEMHFPYFGKPGLVGIAERGSRFRAGHAEKAIGFLIGHFHAGQFPDGLHEREDTRPLGIEQCAVDVEHEVFVAPLHRLSILTSTGRWSL